MSTTGSAPPYPAFSLDTIRSGLNPHAMDYLLLHLSTQADERFKNAMQGLFLDTDFLSFDWVTGTKNRTWWWHAHQLQFLPWHIQAQERAEEPEARAYFRFCRDALLNWIDKASSSPRSPLAWHDHASAFRLRHIVHWLTALILTGRASWLGEKDTRRIMDCIAGHFSFLMKEENYSKHTNHGFDQMLVLYSCALLWGGQGYFKTVADTAQKRLLDEIEFAFTNEGVHKENSAGYQSYMRQVLRRIDELKILDEKVVFPRARALEEKVTAFLEAISLPNGKLPLIGDTQANVQVITPPIRENIEIFDYTSSGYFIVRGRNPDGADFHLVMKSTHLSNYHRHDDDLSIHFYYNGAVLLGDAGIYMYSEKDPLRCFVRSPLAHNTVFPENYRAERDCRKLARPPALCREGEGAVVGESSCYGGRLERRVDFSRIAEGRIEIRDRWLEKPPVYGALAVNYFLPYGNGCDIAAGYAHVATGAADFSIRAHTSMDEPIPAQMVTDKPESPVFYSTAIQEYIPATRVLFRAAAEEKETITSIIRIEKTHDSLRALLDRDLAGLTESALAEALWQKTPARPGSENDLPWVEDLLGRTAPDRLRTEMLYILLRTKIWLRKTGEGETLYTLLEKRDDATPSQRINACKEILFSCAEDRPEYDTHLLRLHELLQAETHEKFAGMKKTIGEKLQERAKNRLRKNP